MASYELTPKGLIQGAIITLEETIQQRSIATLLPQERASMLAETQMVLQYLEARVTTPPEQREEAETLGNIKAILGLADCEMRPLTSTEEAIVIDNVRSLQLLLREETP